MKLISGSTEYQDINLFRNWTDFMKKAGQDMKFNKY